MIEGKKRLLLVDYNNLVHRSVNVNKTLSWNGVPTGGVYGFLNIVCSIVEKYGIDRIIVCKDSKPYFRAQAYKNFKKDRAKLTDEDFAFLQHGKKQVDELLEFLKVVVVKDYGWEADDIIAQYCKIRFRRYPHIYISSTDSDLYQLFSNQGAVFLCKSKGLYGIDNFKEEFPKLKPWEWPKVTALMGSHNGVEGIPSVGIKRAVDLVSNKTTFKEIAAKYNVSFRELKKKVELCTYPYPAIAPGPSLSNDHPLEYNRIKLVRYLSTYGITLTHHMDSALERLASL